MKIPKPTKRGNSYRIQITVDGKRKSVSASSEKECTRKAAALLLNDKVTKDKGNTILFRDLLDLYLQKVSASKSSNKNEAIYTRVLVRDFPYLANMFIDEITPQDITSWRNERLESVSSGTVLREMGFFSHVLTYAQKELFLIDTNPFLGVQKPKANKARKRRITPDEIQTVINSLGYKKGQKVRDTKHIVAWSFLFAIETAMRQGEILGIQPQHIHPKHIHLPKTKNGESRDVPLTNEAIAMLKCVTFPFEVKRNAFRLAWDRALKKTDIVNLNFHDTRHEAISRFVKNKGLPVEILMKITGHKTPKVLINTYYNPTIDELSDMLNN